MGYTEKQYFEITEPSEREAPQVSFEPSQPSTTPPAT
jgi:hypothetical protein